MTVYSEYLYLDSPSNTNPTPIIRNISSSDTIAVILDTSSYASGNAWLRFGTPIGCTVTPANGGDGTTATITPNAGTTGYSATFRTLDLGSSTYYYGRISGTVGATTDTTPDGFVFQDQTNVGLSSTIISDTIIISGIDAPTGISISNGFYSIDGGAYTSSSGTITNGQSVSVLHYSPGSYSTATDTTLIIGGVSDTFTSITIGAPPVDNIPDAFTFTGQTNLALNTAVVSNTITVSGTNSASPISIVGGLYSIDGGAYTSSAGSIVSGQTVSVRHTSSSSYSTTTNTTLTIGGVASTFSSTTEAADITPDAFTFTDQTNVALSTTVTSNTITVSGINSASTISITGGTYSINGGGYTSATGSVTNGQTVSVRHTSSGSNSTATNTTLTIGGVSDTFTSTTLADTIPDAFTFTDQTSVALNTTITSNTITVLGINSASTISITGGAYSVNGGAYTSSIGSVTNGQTVSVRHTSSGSNSTATNTTLNIGGTSDTFTSTTLAFIADNTPDAFTFTDQTSVALSTTITSNTITVSGINASTSISITGGIYNINGGGYTSATGSVTNGQTVSVRHTSPNSNLTTTNTTLTIGSISDTFTSTTIGSQPTPSAFNFTDLSGVSLSSLQTSNQIIISGLGSGISTSISIGGGEYSKNGAGFTTTTTTAVNGDTFTVRHTSSTINNSNVDTILYAGDFSETFRSTTLSSAGSGAYGLRLFNSSGIIILDVSSRTSRFVVVGTTAVIAPGNSVTISIPEMVNNDSWTVLHVAKQGGYNPGIVFKQTGSFSITNDHDSNSYSWDYWVIRS